MININELFKEAYKAKSPELKIISEIKAKFLNYEKSVEGVKTPMNDTIQMQILNKLKNEHIESQSFMKQGDENWFEEQVAIDYLISILPKEATQEEIKEFASTIIEPGNKKGMGIYIKTLKEKYPTSDGKMLSEIVKSLIG